MKNMKHIYIALFALPMIFSGCGKEYFDDAKPAANIITDNWTSNRDIEQVIAGGYYMASGSNQGGIVDWPIVFSELTSDEVLLHKTSGEALAQHDYMYKRQTSLNDYTEVQQTWQAGYFVIQAANDIISFLESTGGINDELKASWVPRIWGEALFLRAWAHFTLVRVYATPYTSDPSAKGIILKLKKSSDPFGYQGLSTVQEVYSQIIADLTKAIELLPETFDAATAPATYADRAKKDAARFLLARVYFQMGESSWGKAKEQIDQILKENKYPLGNPNLAWETNAQGVKASETVFQYVTYNSSQQSWKAPQIGKYFTVYLVQPTVNQRRIVSLSDYFLQKTGWSDTIEAKKDLRYTSLYLRFEAGKDKIDKYKTYSKGYVWGNKWERVSLNSIPLFRSAELFLTRALIKFKSGDAAGAAADLNVVRRRAGLPELTANEISLEIIHTERLKEMAFEGDRTHYLQAQKLNIPNGDRDSNSEPFDSNKFYWDYPLSEYSNNPLITK